VCSTSRSAIRYTLFVRLGLRWVLIWFLVALVTAVPALILLYVLEQWGEIAEEAPMPESYAGPAGLAQ
jgi:1,4-dihydroxy-2-naphthoate octaprenyltransferase